MANKESEDKKNVDSSVEEQEFASEQSNTSSEEAKDTNPNEKDSEESSTEESQSQESELSAAKDKYLRLYAEFENYRRRTSKERADLIKTANEKLMLGLIPVIDDFERSIKALQENETALEGIKLVYNKFKKILEQEGLKAMEVKQGDAFDAEYHEAIVQTPAPDESLKGKIVDVIEQGYFLGDKVLRYAKVVTGS